MRALSLWQPWASAIALGIKTVETRAWSTKYRGPLLIHATQRFPREAREFAATERALGRLPPRLPLGAVVAVATLVDVRPTEEVALEVSALERLYGDYTPGRWAWMLSDVRPLAVAELFGATGLQGLWTPDEGMIEQARAARDRAGGYAAIVDELFPDEAEAARFRQHVERMRGRV